MPLLEPAQVAPAFSLPDQSGSIHTLAQYRGKKVVLYFYPQDDSPKCTDQACAFRDVIPQAAKLNAVILGISPDTADSHAHFAKKFQLPFAILADVSNAKGIPPTSNAFGTWVEKNMYGKKFWGVARVTYLIDERGLIQRRWGKVKVEGHAQEVLDALRDAGGAGGKGGAGSSMIESKPSSKATVAKPNAKKTTSNITTSKKPTVKKSLAKKPLAKSGKKPAKKSGNKPTN